MQFKIYSTVIESNISLGQELLEQQETEIFFNYKKRSFGKLNFSQIIHQIFDDEDESKTPWLKIGRDKNYYLIRFKGMMDFCVSKDGRIIRGYAKQDLAEITIRHLFLTQVLPLALSLHKPLALHASAILSEFGVIAFYW